LLTLPRSPLYPCIAFCTVSFLLHCESLKVKWGRDRRVCANLFLHHFYLKIIQNYPWPSSFYLFLYYRITILKLSAYYLYYVIVIFFIFLNIHYGIHLCKLECILEWPFQQVNNRHSFPSDFSRIQKYIIQYPIQKKTRYIFECKQYVLKLKGLFIPEYK